MKNFIGRKCFIKFGQFHGQMGTIIKDVKKDDSERYLVKLASGKVIAREKKNIIIMGEVSFTK